MTRKPGRENSGTGEGNNLELREKKKKGEVEEGRKIA